MIRITRTRVMVWSVAVLVVVAIALALRPRPVAVDIVAAERGPLLVTVDEEGETRIRDRFVVSAPLTGRVLRIELEPGDAIEADRTVLATFQPVLPSLLDVRTRSEIEARVKSAQALLDRARAERARAESELDFARTDVARQRELAGAGVVSRERLDAAELTRRTREEALRAAGAAVNSAEYELEVAQASLLQITSTRQDRAASPMVLRSPIDGVVLRRHRESEAVVPAGEPLLELGNPADLEIVADFLSTDAVKIVRGARTIIDQWGGDRPLGGRVRRVEPSGFTKISALGVEEQRVNVLIDFDEPEQAWKLLGDGYRVEVRVVVWEAEDVLKVPTSSLFRHDGEWCVFGVEGERAVRRSIQVGRRTGLDAEVLDGLAAGDPVIAFPGENVQDGVDIVARSP